MARADVSVLGAVDGAGDDRPRQLVVVGRLASTQPPPRLGDPIGPHEVAEEGLLQLLLQRCGELDQFGLGHALFIGTTDPSLERLATRA